MSKKQARDEAIFKHGKKLQIVFPKTANMDPTAAYNAVRAIERRANALYKLVLNKPIPETLVERDLYEITSALDTLIGYRETGIPVTLNDDARGYALKIDCKIVRDCNLDIPTDMGGDGILAPEF